MKPSPDLASGKQTKNAIRLLVAGVVALLVLMMGVHFLGVGADVLKVLVDGVMG